MQNQNSESLSRAIHAARAGQPALAKFHCQQAAEIQSDDPLVWLWLAWLADSPSSMFRCLQVAQQDDRYCDIAQAGIAFAQALCGSETDFTGSQNESTDSADVAPIPFRISAAQEKTRAGVAALPEPHDTAMTESNVESQPENTETAEEFGATFEAGPEQQCVEALDELSAEVNGENAGLAAEVSDETPEQTLAGEPDLFAVAQAMLGESSDDSQNDEDGLVAGVSITNDPGTARPAQETEPSTETENADEQAETTTETEDAPEPAETVSPSWADGLNEFDDQSEWSAEAGEFVPVAESASTVVEEALAEQAKTESRTDEPADEELTSDATGLQSDFTTTAHDAGIELGCEQAEKVDDGKSTPTVLVVDDSPSVRKLVQMTLQSRGYNIVTAFDGGSAIKEIARHEPRLILLDINTPRLDGYQLCSLIRKHERTRNIPVVMLSNKDRVFDRIRGKMVGGNSYIVKPFVSETLIKEVEKHIDSHTETIS